MSTLNREENEIVFRMICSILGLCLALSSSSLSAVAQKTKIPPPPAQKPVNYALPPREYKTIHAGVWTIQVEKQLITEDHDLANKALARLKKKLTEALKALPPSSHARLKKLPIYLLYGQKSAGGGRDNGLEYYQKSAPDYDKQLDPHWRSCIVIYSAENYVQISDLWALKAVVHELAHAHQLEQWPEDQSDIYQAWKHATQFGLYHGVRDNQGKTMEKAYAAVNSLEYFAELSCMYFARCNYQPFEREELKTYDPVGYAMIEKMWGLNPK